MLQEKKQKEKKQMRGYRDKLISLRVDSELYNDVKKIIANQNWYNKKSFADLFEEALEKYLEEEKKNKKK